MGLVLPRRPDLIEVVDLVQVRTFLFVACAHSLCLQASAQLNESGAWSAVLGVGCPARCQVTRFF